MKTLGLLTILLGFANSFYLDPVDFWYNCIETDIVYNVTSEGCQDRCDDLDDCYDASYQITSCHLYMIVSECQEPQSSNTSLSGLNICKNEAPFPVDNYDDCEHKCDEIEACDDFMVMVADYQYHAAYYCELILDEDKCCQHRLLIDEVNDYDECYNYCHTNSKCVDFELDYDGEDTCWHHIDICKNQDCMDEEITVYETLQSCNESCTDLCHEAYFDTNLDVCLHHNECGFIPQEEYCKKKTVIKDIESYEKCLDLCDDFEECDEIDYIEHKSKCIHRAKCPKSHKKPHKFSPLRKLLRKLGKFANKNQGKYDDKKELVNLFINKEANKGKNTWYGVDYIEIFEALLTKSESPIITIDDIIDFSEEVEVIDLSTIEELSDDLLSNITEIQDFGTINELINWFLIELNPDDQVDGIQCDYIPKYCAQYNASGYEVYPTDDDGFCPKKPNLGYDVCIDQVLESYCGYCVFIEDNNEKRYVAAEIEDEMQCKLCCNEDPEVTCRGGKCMMFPGYGGADYDDWYDYYYGGDSDPEESTTEQNSDAPSTMKPSTTTTAAPKNPPVCKCSVKE